MLSEPYEMTTVELADDGSKVVPVLLPPWRSSRCCSEPVFVPTAGCWCFSRPRLAGRRFVSDHSVLDALRGRDRQSFLLSCARAPSLQHRVHVVLRGSNQRVELCFMPSPCMPADPSLSKAGIFVEWCDFSTTLAIVHTTNNKQQLIRIALSRTRH